MKTIAYTLVSIIILLASLTTLVLAWAALNTWLLTSTLSMLGVH